MRRWRLLLLLLLTLTPPASAEERVAWPNTWGFLSIDAIPLGDKMAPNGVPYDPLFSLNLLFNVALTRDREVYLYGTSRFWAQKPGDGITNAHQGSFDFSKRQYDLDAGVAWNFYDRFEARAYFFSLNNLNRGSSFAQPKGFKDGTGLELRYYFPTTDFDRGLYRFVAVGYHPTKEMVGNDGIGFAPGCYAKASVAYDFLPEELYAYLDLSCVCRQEVVPKLVVIDPGVAWRPFRSRDEVEFRLGAESTIDAQVGYTRAFGYATVRFVW